MRARGLVLIIFCGVPGSGKTSIASRVARALDRCVHVQTDTIRAMIGPGPRYTSGESKFVYGAAVATAKHALAHRYHVILDATFPREEFRREAMTSLMDLCSSWLVVHVKCDPELAYSRNAARPRPVPLDSFIRIWKNFEPPMGALEIDTGQESLEGSERMVLAAVEGSEDEE